MTEKRLALIIANYQYEDADLRQLVAPAQDAEALARVLSDPMIGGFEVQTLLNEPSHKVNLSIETFFADRKRDDLLLLYFSGHGIKDEEGRLYLATSNTRRKMLRATAVPATLVNDVMRYSRSRQQVLLLDCCYSGAFARGMVVRADQVMGTGEYFREAHGQVVLTASDALQYSFEGNEIKGKGVRSVFTNTLVRGLETGEADLDGDGCISFDELYDYVYDQVTDEMPQQRPRKWVFDVQGEIIIARNPHPAVKSAELPLELLQAIESSFAGVREGAVGELDSLLRDNDEGLALAAHRALTKLADDDSRRVSAAATECLAAYAAAQRVEETERELEPLLAERAERIVAEKSKIERVEPELAEPRMRKKLRHLLPLALVGLLALVLVVGVVVIGLRDGGGVPTSIPTTSAPVVDVQSSEPTATKYIAMVSTATSTPALSPKTPTNTSRPPTATQTPTEMPAPSLTDTPAVTVSSSANSLGDTRTRPADGMEMVYVPAGEFVMGSLAGEGDEMPQHNVFLDAFWIDRTEVSYDQYLKCVRAAQCQPPSRNNRIGDPAKNVSWHEAQTYCSWVGARLPTEAEWEKAARGTDGRKYPWGNEEPDDGKANYCGEGIDCRVMRNAAPVGSFPGGASPYGALDLAGNVWEWVADWYDSSYYSQTSSQNPLGPATGENKVLRGGSYNNSDFDIRSANRHSALPKDGDTSIGFRCVVSP